MSPIITLNNEDGPPSFSDRRPTRTHPNAFDSPAKSDEEEEEFDGHPRYPPSYPSPSSSPPPPPNHKTKDRRRRGEDYGDHDVEGGEEGDGLLYEMQDLGGRLESVVEPESYSSRRTRGEAYIGGGSPGFFGATRPSRAAWREIREMMYETTPTLMLTLLGLVFTGELLEHLSHWKVFERVDELFILVPMIANLKGNLEMCLGARLSTSANIGELDVRTTRRSLILGQLSLLQLQALAVSFLAAILSFLLGLTMPHRISDDPLSFSANSTLHRLNSTSPTSRNIAIAAGMFFERDDPDLGYFDSFREGYTPPGGKELVFILVTGMLSASISGAVLGSFVSALVVLSRRLRINPDNISTPIAACLSDLVTLFILGIVGTLLLPYIATPVPVLILPFLILAGAGFAWTTLRNQHVKGLVKDGWTPLLAAVTISSATGMVLERCVSRYEGFAILAVAMTGLSGAVGSIHASRLSTILHQAHPPPSGSSTPHHHPSPSSEVPSADVAAPRAIAVALFIIALPVQVFFLLFVGVAGWMRVGEWQLVVSFVLVFAFTVFLSIYVADRLTLFFWSKSLDPDSYTLPIHSSLIDLVGQVLLVVAFELAAFMGGNVRVVEGVAAVASAARGGG